MLIIHRYVKVDPTDQEYLQTLYKEINKLTAERDDLGKSFKFFGDDESFDKIIEKEKKLGVLRGDRTSFLERKFEEFKHVHAHKDYKHEREEYAELYEPYMYYNDYTGTGARFEYYCDLCEIVEVLVEYE